MRAIAPQQLYVALMGKQSRQGTQQGRFAGAVGTTHTDPSTRVQVQRHPIKRNVSHIDFLAVDMNETIHVQVPLRLQGEAKAVLSEGGLVDAAVDTIEVECTPANIPNEFIVDVTGLQLHGVIRLADVTMPKGVTAVGDPEMPVVTAIGTAAGAAGATEAPAAEAPAAQ